MFKNSRSICYVFFAVGDVIVTSVNTYTSLVGINTEDKYLIKSLRVVLELQHDTTLVNA